MSTKETLKALQTQATKELAAAEREIAQLGPKFADLKAKYDAAQARAAESRQQLQGFAIALGEGGQPEIKAEEAKAAAPSAKIQPVRVAPAKAADIKAKPATTGPVKTAIKAKAPAKAPAKAVKAAPKAKVKTGGDVAPKAAKPAKSKSQTKAAEGRRAVAQGLRPTLPVAIAHVMGAETMHASQILPKLKEKGWTPSAGNPVQYIGHTLSTQPEMFVRDPSQGRGFYKVTDAGRTKAQGAIEALKAKGQDKAVVAADIPAPRTDVAKGKKNGVTATPSTNVDDALTYFGGAATA